MKPILKWAGGKRWLLPALTTLWEPYQDRRLVEPFVGGMAVALGLNPRTALLNDVNVHLINLYRQVSKGLVVTQRFKNEADYYYTMRERFNNLIRTNKYQNKEAANIFYFLIRTGFNGLCRFNSDGIFNVPFGQHASIKYRKDFLDYKDIFQNWDFMQGDFAQLALIEQDFIYADPPYDVEFTKYSAKGFNWTDQERLATWLAQHPGPVAVSNQATARILKLYRSLKFTVFTLPAPRRIACNGDRSYALEMLAVRGIPLQLKRVLIDRCIKDYNMEITEWR